MKIVGICFSPEKDKVDPLSHVGKKRPVYDRLLDLCVEKGWRTFVFTKKTYLGESTFEGAWEYKDKKLTWIDETIKADLVYDRTGGVKWPIEGDKLKVVNIREFKLFCWDKWAAYQKLSEYMPKTFWIENLEQLEDVVPQIKTDWIVIKPFNGLQGQGIYIGPKEKYKEYEFSPKFKKYIAQEFIDTSDGVPNVVPGMHDIRIVVINKKTVWGHVRVPAVGSYLSNAAGGGILTEIDFETIPQTLKDIVIKIAEDFYEKYDNPIFSVDFGVGKDAKPYIFEINDQIGFPKWEMKDRENFLVELVANFESKLSSN